MSRLHVKANYSSSGRLWRLNEQKILKFLFSYIVYYNIFGVKLITQGKVHNKALKFLIINRTTTRSSSFEDINGSADKANALHD